MGIDFPTKKLAELVAGILEQGRFRGSHRTGRLAPDGPLEDSIDAVEVRVDGDDAEAGLAIVFRHRAYPARVFGLRTGALWKPTADGGSLCDPAALEEEAGYIATWAEDYPFLQGLPDDRPAGEDGVIWIGRTWRDQLSE
jgi:hypothetical protein